MPRQPSLPLPDLLFPLNIVRFTIDISRMLRSHLTAIAALWSCALFISVELGVLGTMGVDEGDFVMLHHSDAQDFNDGGLLPQPLEEIERIQRWLQPTDYAAESSEAGRHFASYLPGTGNWVQETDQYREWQNSREIGSLWIKAVPGAGKSVFAAVTASKLATEEKAPVLYFFFRQIIAANQSPKSLVRDFLSQLLRFSPLLQSDLKKLIDDNRQLDSVSFDELWQKLLLSLSGIPRVYCIVDALDEMNISGAHLLADLIRLGEHNPASVKLLMTSRPVPWIEKFLKHPSILQIIFQPKLIETDVRAYVEHRLNSCNFSTFAQSSVRDAVCSRANGLFLYARLMMDDILNANNDPSASELKILATLQKLPTTLADMYTAMLLDHSTRSGVSQELQLTILRWVTCAERPLRLLELAEIIDFEKKAIGVSQDTKSVVRIGCGPLLEILEDETVSVVHHSFTEYLFDRDREQSARQNDGAGYFPSLEQPGTQRAIAVTCIDYLISGWSDTWDLRSEDRLMEYRRAKYWGRGIVLQKHTPQSIKMKLKHPFLDYAATYWHRHLVKYGKGDDEVFRKVDRFMIENNKAFKSWLDLTRPHKPFHQLTPMHVAAHKGIGRYIEHLIHIGWGTEPVEHNSRTPISIAAIEGNADVVAVLLSYGAQSNHKDDSGLNPLVYAAIANHYKVVELLLDAGVDPLTPITQENARHGRGPAHIGETAVHCACYYGHLETIKALMPRLSPDSQDLVLHLAALFGSTKVVLAVLESPHISVNKVTHGKTPLYLASCAQDLTMMRALLDRGADARIMSDNDFNGPEAHHLSSTRKKEYTPLHGFITTSNSFLIRHGGSGPTNHRLSEAGKLKKGFEMLLAAGCDIDALDGWGHSVLHSLVGYQVVDSRGLDDAMSFLMSKGASPTKLASDGSTILHLLAGASQSIISRFIDSGVDVNAVRTSDSKTPLMVLVSQENYRNLLNIPLNNEVTMCIPQRNRQEVMALLTHGADCNLSDANGWTPLHFLVSKMKCDIETLKLLLSEGADPNAKNHDGNTPLHLAASDQSSDEVVSILLDHKADLEVKNNKGRTAFLESIMHIAYGNGGKMYVKLIEAGANVHAVDYEGFTAMHISLIELSAESTVLGYLAARGVDARRTDNSGNTLLHVIANRTGNCPMKEQTELLLDQIIQLGVPPSAKNHAGQTVLHFAFGTMRYLHHFPGQSAMLDFFLGPRCNLSVDDGDNNGARPIHLTSSMSESLTLRLLGLGANPSVLTSKGQSPLMMACASRASNIVGLLVDLYNERGESAYIHCTDHTGRSALHFACRSGRPESVKILLAAGANPNLKDDRGLTPLHACAEVPVEEACWKSPYGESEIDEDPVGVRESIRWLIEYGADTSFLEAGTASPIGDAVPGSALDPLNMAIQTNCEAMVEELISLLENVLEPNPGDPASEDSATTRVGSEHSSIGRLSRADLLSKSRPVSTLLTSQVRNGGLNLSIVHDLLRSEHDSGIQELRRLCGSFAIPDSNGESPMTIMIRWGYHSLVKRFGSDASAIVSPSVYNAQFVGGFEVNGKSRPLLSIACERELPNLDVIKVLVEKVGVNINELDESDGLGGINYGNSALHILAYAKYWWQPKALEYLINQGADIEIKNLRQETPLFSTIDQGFMKEKLHAVKAAETLLRAGANPNVNDRDGLSCLHRARRDPELVKIFIEYGADVMLGKKPFIFDAIWEKNVEIIRVLVQAGADCNVRPQLVEEDNYPHVGSVEDPLPALHESLNPFLYVRPEEEEEEEEAVAMKEILYPINLAASGHFNTDELKSTMVTIIKLLLEGGADPFLTYSNGKSILHNIACDDGILDPFLTLPNVDLEARDSKGRTLFLAACCARFHRRTQGDTLNALSLLISHNASIHAVDSKGRNALHSIILKSRLHANLAEDIENILSQPTGPILAHQRDATGRAPIHYAFYKENLEATDILVRHGANAMEPDPVDGNTALHHIARVLVSRFAMNHYQHRVSDGRKHFYDLLKRGFDINARNSLGETPMFSFVATAPPPLPHGSEETAHMSLLPLFEEAGADFMVRNKKGEGLLHRLAGTAINQHLRRRGDKGVKQEVGMVALFKKLMQKGCDPTWEDDEQRTCLDVAAVTGNQAILELFQRKTS